MHGRHHRRRPLRLHRDPALLHDAEVTPEQSLRRGGAEADDDARADEGNFLLEPRMAGANLPRVRRLVNPPLGACVPRPLEVLHGVRDVHVVAVDPSGIKCTVEQLARWSDEGPPRLVFLIPGLFTDDHHVRGSRPFAEHRLRAELEKVATPAPLRRCPKLRKRRPGGYKVSGGAGWLRCSFRLRHAARDLRRAGDFRRWEGRNSRPGARPPIPRFRRVSRASRR